jgi:hypothetical protein
MINIEFGKRITESNYHNGYDTYNQPICTLSFLDEIDLIRFKEANSYKLNNGYYIKVIK